jgi:predicted kinase
MTEAVIFDIDGTLADLTHRIHHISGGKRDWLAFFEALSDDTIYSDILRLNHMINMARGVSIILVSGRPETYRTRTEKWLSDNDVYWTDLYMRTAGDHRADYIVKSQILDKLIADGVNVLFVVDDRQSVVNMWRERGLTCLQCRESSAPMDQGSFGKLTLMVGPSGAGKTTWLGDIKARMEYGILPDQIVSSDRIRHELCGDFRDQSKNEQVFTALHALVRTRVSHGLPAVVDATNIRRKDRLGIVGLSQPDAQVRYIVMDRPLAEKHATADWREDIIINGVSLIDKHDATFKSNLADILAGDGLPNVQVVDLRSGA